MALPSPRDPDVTRATLAAWLAERVGTGVEVSRPTGPPLTGFSNETILVEASWDDGDGPTARGLAVRVQPTRHTVFPDDTFAVQHRVLAALGGRPDVRVPRLRWVEDDPSVLGAPFMVMDRAEGEAVPDNPPYAAEGWLRDGGPALQRAVWDDGLDAMAEVHRLDLRSVGLDDLDPCPAGGSRLAHRLDGWERMLRWVAPEQRFEVIEAGLAWLRAEQPPDVDAPALCWGDSRLANQLFARQGPSSARATAVLDWEMVHVGDPVQDLGWFTCLDGALTEGVGLARPPGFPPGAATRERWEEATGRSAAHHGWAEVLAGVGFAIVMVRISQLLEHLEVFPPGSDFARANPGHTHLAAALAERDVHPSDVPA